MPIARSQNRVVINMDEPKTDEEIHDKTCDCIGKEIDTTDSGTFDWEWKMKFAQLAAQKAVEPYEVEIDMLKNALKQ